jgi:signal transduction histidine kinase
VRRAAAARGLVIAAAAILGVAAFDAARRAPGFALAGDSVGLAMLGVAPGWAVVGAGLVLAVRDAPLAGRLLAGAGCAWLAAGLGTPGTRLAVLFTLGLVAVAAAPALVGHALLAAAGEGTRSRLDRALVATLYLSLAGLLGLLPTLLFDPAAAGCASCPANLLGVADAPAAVADLSRWGIRLGLVATACAVALALWRLARAPAARRRHAAPLVVPGCAYLGLVAAQLAHAWSRGFLGSDPVDQALWAAQAGALLGVAGGVALLRAAARRRRARLARLVVDLSGARGPGGLRDALAGVLGDPELELLYASAGGWIDGTGREREPRPGVATTPLVREGEPVALLCHRPGLLDDPRLAGEIERSVRLGLEHERLQSELQRQLAHLRRSRADVVAAAEAERRLLERDLHDGAQQRLVAFAFALGIARRHAGPDRAAALERAQREVQEALGELRELAHGLYPVALSEAGLAAAVESLSDRRPGLAAAGLPAERFVPAVEETAYFAIASLAEQWSPEPVELASARDGKRLVIDLRTLAAPPAQMVDVEDRVGALGGALAVTSAAGAETRVTVELPCA